MISNNNLFQIITEPTHITPTSATLLDLIITDSPSIIVESGLDEPIGDPYHSMVFCTVYLQRVQEKSYTRTVWHYNHGDYDAFRKELELMPWQIMENFDIDEWAELWTNEFLKIAQNNILQRQVKIHPKDKYFMTTEIKKLWRKRNHLWKQWK